jgi:serine protease
VCVIDSGVHIGHEDFAGVNFTGGFPSGWDTDLCGHGTHVAGTIAAANNTTGVVGVTPGEVSLYIVKVFGDSCQWTYSSALFDAALKCRDAGADIISISTGGNTYSALEEMVFDGLYQDDGILTIASAGNHGVPNYFYPASLDSVVSVAAVDADNVRAFFSRYNDQVELAAPGVDILSTYNDGSYVLMSGTSMAAPHVSAAAAVVWSSDTSKTNEDIRLVLQQTALDLGAPGRDDEYGFGLIQSFSAYNDLRPTAVDLVRFEAIAGNDSIRLEWETATEIDHLGFNLYRAESPGGPRTQLNDSLIPSHTPGSTVGATYQFVDSGAAPGTPHYYWLEDVDTSGHTTLHGPVKAEMTVYRLFLPVIKR